jgi:acid stress-induced BolA-like protein IbaG/YrbA
LVNHKNTTITTTENVQKIIEAVTKSNAANMGGSNAHVNVTVIMQQPTAPVAVVKQPVQQAVVAAPPKAVPQHNVQIT